VAPSLWLRGPVVSLRLRAVPPPKIKSGCRSISLQNRMAAGGMLDVAEHVGEVILGVNVAAVAQRESVRREGRLHRVKALCPWCPSRRSKRHPYVAGCCALRVWLARGAHDEGGYRCGHR
jgi:hypothetical protein